MVCLLCGQENFGQLNYLIVLDLSCNKLQSLPDSFGQLVLLQKLDLYSNQLISLPFTFWNLRKLKWLDLKNNPLEPGLSEAAGTCVTSRDCNHCATKASNVMSSFSLGQPNPVLCRSWLTSSCSYQRLGTERMQLWKKCPSESSRRRMRKKRGD